MKILVIALVLMAICITSSQSQMIPRVSDAKLEAILEEGIPGRPHIFERESTLSICVNQTFDAPTTKIVYYIYVKNTGETNLTNVTLEDILPDGVVYSDSYYFDPVVKNLNLTDLISNRDGTTKILRWRLVDLETGDEKKIMVIVDRDLQKNDRANDRKNMVTVTAEALNDAEREAFGNVAEEIAEINPSCTNYTTIEDVDLKTSIDDKGSHYEIQVENQHYAKLKDVVLNVTLPKNATYHLLGDLPEPVVTSNSNSTTLSFDLTDFIAREERVIKLNVSCNDSDKKCLSKVEATGKMSIIHYHIHVENTGKTRLTDVILNYTLPARTHYLESIPPNPTIISNPDGTTKRLSWFLGDLETGANNNKTIELNVSCLDYNNCSLGNIKVEASGWTSIVHKMPILINNSMSSASIPAEQEKTSDTSTPPSPPPEGNDTEMKGPEVNDSAVNASFIDRPMPEINSSSI